MDVVALVPLTVVGPVVMVVTVVIMTVVQDPGRPGHTAPAAAAAPFLGGIESNPLMGWSRYGNVSR